MDGGAALAGAAAEDERAASALIEAAAPIVGAAAFHCQQAAEKMAKAVLIAHREPPPRIHDIAALAVRVAALDAETGTALAALGGITSWYTAARYPDADAGGEPGIADIREALSQLRALGERIEALGSAGG